MTARKRNPNAYYLAQFTDLLEKAAPEARTMLKAFAQQASEEDRAMLTEVLLEAVRIRLSRMKIESQIEAACDILHNSRLEIVEEPK